MAIMTRAFEYQSTDLAASGPLQVMHVAQRNANLACRYTIGGEHLILREKHMKTAPMPSQLECGRRDSNPHALSSTGT
jgi:hypothetical protein